MAETTIWQDDDIQEIFALVDGQPQLLVGHLGLLDREPIHRFTVADNRAMGEAPASAYVEAGLAGVAAAENLSPNAPVGWTKFIVYEVALNARVLWNTFRRARETSAFGDWVVNTCDRYG